MSLTREDCYVGQKVVVVQKTKSNIGNIVKLNPKTAVVERDGFYRTRVPYSMLKRHEVAAPPQPPPLPTALEIENEKLKEDIKFVKRKNFLEVERLTQEIDYLKAEIEKLRVEIVPLEIDFNIKSFAERQQIRKIIQESLLACLDVLTPFHHISINDEDVPDMMKHKADDLCDKFKVSRMIGMTLMKELFEVKDGVMVLRDGDVGHYDKYTC